MHSIVTTFRGAVIKVEVANFCAAMDTLIDQDAFCYDISIFADMAKPYTTNISFITSAKEITFSIVFVCPFQDCYEHYSKRYKHIAVKFYGGIWGGENDQVIKFLWWSESRFGFGGSLHSVSSWNVMTVWRYLMWKEHCWMAGSGRYGGNELPCQRSVFSACFCYEWNGKLPYGKSFILIYP